MTATVHKVAQQGFGDGTNELYDRARPSYQPLALSHIRKAVRGSAPLNVLELGAGTGIFTRALLAHPEWTQSIRQLKAIEPSEGMRKVFSDTVKDERVSVADGTFEKTGVEDGWADLVVVAQAFHWCPDYDKAAQEFARVLKPNGIVTLIWNLEDRDAAPWVAQLRDRVESHEQGTPQFRLMLWRAVFSTESYQRLFEPQEEVTWETPIPGTRQIAIDRACSKSYIAVLPPDEKEKVKKDVGEIIDKGDGMKWIDKDKGIFEYPYKTYVVIWRKK
ncbi:S-adenosyl-L-methionine-dependent methyltransferase [Panus rudis PR-1116 ss-1]|nr:S-adenosyl-L-methionine-dependent methyltransferase [Panus rudis PR-1116 ss-1]